VTLVLVDVLMHISAVARDPPLRPSDPSDGFVMTDLSGHQGTVLLIEDDDASQYVYSTVLAHYGYAVTTARTGLLGMELLDGPLPDVVVLDIGLPGIDGFEILSRIRADARTAHLPVLIITVHVFAADQERAAAAGCDVFLKKPLQPALLATEVQRLLAETRPSPEPV
jgi:CheY-like chemotaxis protein